MDSMPMFELPDYCVTTLNDDEAIDPILLEIKLEKASAEYIKSFLELEANPASVKDILLLTTGGFKDLTFDTVLTAKHIEEIWGMHKAINFLLESYNQPLNYHHLEAYNEMVVIGARKKYAGQLRKTDVTIMGTLYSPPQFEMLPRLCDNMFEAVHHISGVKNKAVSYLLAISKTQFFIDGNKRTARLAAQHTLMNMGQRFLSFNLDTLTYVKCLKAFYETGDKASFVDFFENNLFEL